MCYSAAPSTTNQNASGGGGELARGLAGPSGMRGGLGPRKRKRSRPNWAAWKGWAGWA